MAALEEWGKLNDNELLDAVKSRLAVPEIAGQLKAQPEDSEITYQIGRVSEQIKNTIHQSYVPAGLKYVLIERVSGAILNSKYNTGETTAAIPVTSVKVGDTSVNTTSSQSFATIITEMQNYGEATLMRYRKLCF